MFDNVMAVVVGTAVGMLCIVFMQMGIYHFYPLPPGTDLYDAASAQVALSAMPAIVLWLLTASYVIGSLIAGIVASLISKRNTKNPALICGVLMAISGIINVTTIHYPLWFTVATFFAYLPFAYVGYIIVRKKQAKTI
jgi:hypothetical protein